MSWTVAILLPITSPSAITVTSYERKTARWPTRKHVLTSRVTTVESTATISPSTTMDGWTRAKWGAVLEVTTAMSSRPGQEKIVSRLCQTLSGRLTAAPYCSPLPLSPCCMECEQCLLLLLSGPTCSSWSHPNLWWHRWFIHKRRRTFSIGNIYYMFYMFYYSLVHYIYGKDCIIFSTKSYSTFSYNCFKKWWPFIKFPVLEASFISFMTGSPQAMERPAAREVKRLPWMLGFTSQVD